MAIAARERDRFLLPARVRAKKVPEDGFSCRLALADRIAELPGIHTVDQSHDTLPCTVHVHLGNPLRVARNQQAPRLLCSISRDGIGVHGLADWEKYQVLCRAWGKLQIDCVLIHLPRDGGELEVCWNIIQRAYRALTEASDEVSIRRMTSPWDLPRFSRTTHQ